MDRDRRRRDLDIPPEDRFRNSAGQSYRPGGARERSPPPRSDSYRARSPPPPRRDYSDTYRRGRSRSPPPRRDEYRRRSPSPPRDARYRDGRDVRSGDSYRAPARRDEPPPRREDLPRDDLFRREPARDYRDEREYRDERGYTAADDGRDRGYRAGSPRYRDRSPVPLKRGRDPSPIHSRGRTTPGKRERLASPPRGRYDDYAAPPSRPASPPRRRYSPDPRERRASPPRGGAREYRPRSRSPPARHERVDPRSVDDWRRRSPSPQQRFARQEYLADTAGGRDSVTTSRRSSPPVHPSRLALQQPPADERPSRPPPSRDPYDSRETYRDRSPEPARRRDSPPPRERERGRDYADLTMEDRVPPPREPYRADDVPVSRAPPSGPAGYRAPSTSSMAPPTGPSAGANVSISAHTRAPAAPPSGPRAAAPVAPSAPRGDFSAPRGRGGFGGRGGGFGAPFRGGRGGGAPPVGGFPSERSQSFTNHRESFDAGAPPSGPRSSISSQPSPTTPLAFRQSSNMTATTYPRTQRFASNGAPLPSPTNASASAPLASTRMTTSPPTGPASGPPTGPSGAPTGPRNARVPPVRQQSTVQQPSVSYLSSLPEVVAGGSPAPPVVDTSRLTKLQEEAEKLRRQIEEKEARKRKNLREWEKLEREVEVAGLRSELADQAVRELAGESVGTAAF